MKFLSYFLSIIFGIVFFLILLIFHPVQWIAFNVFGYQAHKRVVDLMNFCLMQSTIFLGIPNSMENEFEIPEGEVIIFVCNHQSLFDIPPLGWYFRKHHPKFVSKIELKKGFPSVSYNLRNGGSVLIDRKNGKQAIASLMAFARYLKDNKRSAVIFPEGTRSKNGVPKEFANSGLKVLTKFNKDGHVVPVTVNNSWKTFKYGKFPLGIFSPIKFKVHQPIKIDSMPFDELFAKTESVIKKHII